MPSGAPPHSPPQLCPDAGCLLAAHSLCPSGRPRHWQGRTQLYGVSSAPGRAAEAASDQPSLSHRLQTDQEPSPLPQASWAMDGYSGPPGGTQDSFSGMGKCPRDGLAPGEGRPVPPGRPGLPRHYRASAVNGTLTCGHAWLHPELVLRAQDWRVASRGRVALALRLGEPPRSRQDRTSWGPGPQARAMRVATCQLLPLP